MNIQALNSSATLGRRQVPRNNDVAFGKKIKLNKEKVEGAKTATKGIIRTVGSKIADGAKAAGKILKNSFSKAKQTGAKFVSEHKGAKGVKFAAAALTAVVAGGFAIKEIYDIVTKSNPER